MKRFAGTVLGVAVMLLAASCGEVAQPAPTVTPGATPTTAKSAEWNAKLEYQMSGGIAGRSWTLTIGPNGQARLVEGSNNSGPVALTAQKLSDLKAKLAAAHFFDLKDRYGTGNVADDFILTMTVTEGGKTKSVVVEQVGGQGVTPAEVSALFGAAEAIGEEVRAMATPTTVVP